MLINNFEPSCEAPQHPRGLLRVLLILMMIPKIGLYYYIKNHFSDLNYVVTLDNGILKATFHTAGVTYAISKNEISSNFWRAIL